MTWTNIAETDRQRIASWQKWMLTLAILCEIFLAADWYAFAAVLPFVSETLKLDPAEAGLAQGIFALTYGIGMVVWSPISRTMSARRASSNDVTAIASVTRRVNRSVSGDPVSDANLAWLGFASLQTRKRFGFPEN